MRYLCSMEQDFTKYLIAQGASVLDALRLLNSLSGVSNTIFAVDEQQRLVGTVTDGDLRRSLVAGASLDAPLTQVMHRDFCALRGETVDVAHIRNIRNRKISLVPHLNADGTIRTVYNFEKLRSVLPLDAVLMAGGKGERLRPLTLTTPKPLLKVGDKCIIDYNIEALARNGVKHISVTTNYLHEQMAEHFAMPVGGVQVECVKEPCRMGTIGSLKLVKEFFNDDILVMNSDLLTTVNYEEMFLTHCESGAALTVATIPYMVSIPYAIMRMEGDDVRGLEEKPTFNYFANAGIYIFRRDMIRLIPDGEYFDATDFMEAIIASGEKVRQYPINGAWIDIGSPDDFRRAQELMRQHKFLSE